MVLINWFLWSFIRKQYKHARTHTNRKKLFYFFL